MKINIITNTFGQNLRQTIALDSWVYLKNKYPDIIQILDFQFYDDPDYSNKREGEIRTIPSLMFNSQKRLGKNARKLPEVYEILQKGSTYCYGEEDYVIFVNSDVILMPRLIEHIIKNKPKAFTSSRLDIAPIDSFERVLNKEVTPVRYECFGSDVFVFSKKFYNQYYELFSTPYFYGSWRWDNVWTALIKLLNPEEPLGVYFPPYAFHIHHGLDSVMKEYPEKSYNENLLQRRPMDKLAYIIYSNYLNDFILKRPDAPTFLKIGQDELSKEIEYFSKYKI